MPCHKRTSESDNVILCFSGLVKLNSLVKEMLFLMFSGTVQLKSLVLFFMFQRTSHSFHSWRWNCDSCFTRLVMQWDFKCYACFKELFNDMLIVNRAFSVELNCTRHSTKHSINDHAFKMYFFIFSVADHFIRIFACSEWSVGFRVRVIFQVVKRVSCSFSLVPNYLTVIFF